MQNAMTPERYQQIGNLYHAALELASEDRVAFLAETCAGDEALLREVESLLAANEQAGDFIQAPALEVAAELLTVHQAKFLIGRSIGSYKILKLLGKGGMGEVYLAQDSRLGRRVALKLLPNQFIKNEDRLRRFRQEARAASALNHPNIITIHEVGETETTHYIVTELIEGETLRALLRSHRIDLVSSLDIAVQIASALVAAHAAGIVHRDIKPENIMVRSDGYVKVLDFGIAKLLEAPNLIGALVETNPRLVLGTARYMSPEQAQRHKVDERTDIWSLGVVLNEMVTGQLPSEEYGPEVPVELQQILIKALQKNPEERYQTAREVLIDLKTVQQDLNARVKTAEEIPDAQTFVRAIKHRWLAASVALAVMLIMIGVAAYLLRSSNDKSSSRVATRNTINPEAFQAYLKGRYHWNKRTPEGLRKSIEYFNEALGKEPTYAQAYAGIADSYNVLARFNLMQPRESYPKAKAAAERALEIDETLAEAHASLAVVKMDYEWDLSGAEREFKRALALNPTYPEAHQWYGLLLAARGQTEEGIAEMKRAQQLDPLSLIVDMGLGGLYIYARRYDEAIVHLKKTREMHPEAFQPDANLAYVYELKGMRDEAVASYLKSRTLAGDTSERVGALEAVYRSSGWSGYLRKRIEEMKQQLKLQKYVSPFSMALLYVQIDDKNQALAWLEKTYEERNYRLLFIKIDARLDGLRSDPRFADLVRRIDQVSKLGT